MYGITDSSLWWDLMYESTSRLLTSMKDETTKQSKSDEFFFNLLQLLLHQQTPNRQKMQGKCKHGVSCLHNHL